MAVSTSQLLNRMTDLENQSPPTALISMLYGPPGGGKTTLAAGLAQALADGVDDNGIAYVDTSNNWVALNNFEGLKTGMKHIPYTELGELTALASAIKSRKKGFGNIGVVIIDEVSTVADDVLDQIVREKNNVPVGDPLPPAEWTEYKPMGDLIRQVIKAFIDIPDLHVILIAHSRTDKDNRGVAKTSASLSPKLRSVVSGLMHVVGYVSAEVKDVKGKPTYVRTIQPLLSGLVEAKSRVGGLELKMDFFDFIQHIVSWVDGDNMAQDLSVAEEQKVYDDDIPTDGIPVSEEPVLAGQDDDAPAFVGTV